ncbi:carboxypeptidase-like regulatory domain-containing protein [Flavobacterium sp. SUN052]|uniref:carboxypeptidase-like regulatory domain-containing protein n=1 Tax=Flavobacterium sp. SUN052 TaxID=3002441 RepID=UPI00237E44B0|nr:carboxypeptidase-like regulatory domain-containing protein [Flavobacterium sp. SUN052]MEC4005808.1 carboxypeptidase-like regulatory domain-containing protein [Flavobacterium sp. SUN052]
MKTITLLFFLCFATLSYSQVIKGKVVDTKNQPLPGANIYFDGTTIATIADENGQFILNYSSKINSVLAISFIGYQTQFIKDVEVNKDLKIVLIETINSLSEVIIKKDRFSRKEKLKLFREQFLGTSSTAKKAVILNEDDLYFEYDEVDNSLKAFSDKPLIINNATLGYKLNYELVNFEVKFYKLSIDSSDAIRSYYSGLSRFEETQINPKISKQREKCYEGSQMHFFRNLVKNIWNKQNFLLFKGSFQDNPDDYFKVTYLNDSYKVEITKQDQGLRNKKFVAEFNLLFDKKHQSKIIFETTTFFVDKFGNNSNIEDIIFSGYIASQKVGDLVPMNYAIE